MAKILRDLGWVLQSLVALLVFLGSLRVANAQELDPAAPESSEAFNEYLEAARGSTRRELVARYDAHLAAAPSDHRVAVERCRFLARSSGAEDEDEDEDEGEGEDDEASACVAELEATRGREPVVIVYRLGQMWGEPAIEYGNRKLEDRAIVWPEKERGAALGVLAERHHMLKHLKDAHDLALRAGALDPKYDSSYLVADYLHSVGERGEAVDALAARLHDDKSFFSLHKKARLLLELKAPKLALTAIEAASRLNPSYPDPALHASALEATGDTAGARALYAKQQNQWNREEVLTRLFRLDLTRGSAREAEASYRALRELGWSTDPIARYRLELTLRYPSAAWRFQDVLGVLGLVGLLLAAGLAPAILVLPVHYVGLLRGGRGADPETRWKLWHAFAALSLIFVGDIAASYVFSYQIFATIFEAKGLPDASEREIAHAGFLSLLTMYVVAMVFTRKADWKGLEPARWFNATTLRLAFKFLLLTFGAALVNGALMYVFGWTSTASTPEVALTTEAILRAIREVYGTPLTLALVVVFTPLAEEVVFRGVLLSGFNRYLPFAWANGLQAAVFALMHGEMARLPHLMALGVLAGILRRRVNSLNACTLLHAMNNAIASLVAFLR